MFSREFSEISKNTFSYRTPPVAASEYQRRIQNPVKQLRWSYLRKQLTFLNVSKYVAIQFALI